MCLPIHSSPAQTSAVLTVTNKSQESNEYILLFFRRGLRGLSGFIIYRIQHFMLKIIRVIRSIRV